MVHWLRKMCAATMSFCALTLVLAGATAAQAPFQPALPVSVPDTLWEPLREHHDVRLQSALESRLRSHKKWASLIEQERMAVGVVDLADPGNARFAGVNGDVMMYAASLPKIAILLTAMQQIEDGKLRKTNAVMRDLNDMIRVSNNQAATRMIDRVGGLAAIDEVLQDPRYRFFDPANGGGLWVGKRYAKTGARYPDPILGLSHAATATQVSRFYYLVAEGRLINRERSREMLEILSDPGIDHKFVNALRRVAPRAKLFRKSGSWKNWHSDSVLVWGPDWRRYIVVCLVEDPNGERIIRDLIPEIETVLRPRARHIGDSAE
ncbi:MAG: serine hydrolase [Rhodothermales bacterium]